MKEIEQKSCREIVSIELLIFEEDLLIFSFSVSRYSVRVKPNERESSREKKGEGDYRKSSRLREEEEEEEEGSGMADSDNTRSRHERRDPARWKMNNVDERFNPFRSAGFSFHRARRGLEEAKLDGAALKRNQMNDGGDVCDVLFEGISAKRVSHLPIRSSPLARRISASKSAQFQNAPRFFLRPRVSFETISSKSLSSIIVHYRIKLFLFLYIYNIRRNWRRGYIRDEEKTTKTFPFLSRGGTRKRVSRGKRDSEKVKLDPGARFLSASFPFYRESKLLHILCNGTLESRTPSPSLLPCRPNNYSFSLV